MNRYLLYCLLALLLPLPATTAQRGLPAGLHFPANRTALPAPAFSTTFFPPAAVATSATLPASAPAAPLQEASLARHTLQELQLSWQFIKQQFRYEQ